MSNAWTGLDKKARKVNSIFVGVNNKAKKAVCAWVGVNGVAKYCFPEQIAIPTVSGTYEYTGNIQSAIVNYDSDNVDLSGNTATNAGTHTITAHLKHDYLRWADGSKTDKQITWVIAPKVLNTPTPKYTFYFTGRDLGVKLFRPKYWNVYSDYSNEMSVTNYTSGANIGTYSVTFTLSDSNYVFSNGQNTVTTSYTINKTNITLRYAYSNTNSYRKYKYYEGESVEAGSSASSGYLGHLISEIWYYNSSGTWTSDVIYLYASNDFALGYGSLNDEDWELSRIYLNNPWGKSNNNMIAADYNAMGINFQYSYGDTSREALGIIKFTTTFTRYTPSAGSYNKAYGYFYFIVDATGNTNESRNYFSAPYTKGFS